MEFFYPNFQNDMWRIMGLIFYLDKEHFIVKAEKRFDKEKVEQFCTEKGIALFDTAQAVYRTMGTASDKDLEIVEPTDIASLLNQLPHCHTIVSTGQKSAEVLCELFACKMPKMGESCTVNYQQKTLQFYRMPSSSRAYPLQLEKKLRCTENCLNLTHEATLPASALGVRSSGKRKGLTLWSIPFL